LNKIVLHKGDITKLEVDAIVNAANSSLLGGGGVDGAIHRAAGFELLEKCILLNGCSTGDAKITKGYNLPSKFVIHTVGPIWSNGENDDSGLLKSAYKRCLELAVENNLKTIAFPNISTGVYGFPKNKAADIALNTVNEFLNKHSSIEEVTFAIFDDENYEIYQQMILNR